MNDYRIIHALEDHHVPHLLQLYKGAWWSHDRTIEQVRAVLEGSDLVVGLSARPDDRLIAFARVLTDGIFRAMIFDVIVAPDHQGHGLGHRIIQALLSHPLLKRVELVELYCRPDLVPFYQSLGFASPGSGVVLLRRRGKQVQDVQPWRTGSLRPD
jgi:GNAT superfamily N-acetyltransferase